MWRIGHWDHAPGGRSSHGPFLHSLLLSFLAAMMFKLLGSAHPPYHDELTLKTLGPNKKFLHLSPPHRFCHSNAKVTITSILENFTSYISPFSYLAIESF
jgi:hypothetical protein